MNKRISGIEYTFNGETEGIEADDFRIAVRACESGKNPYTLNGKKYTAHGTIYDVETGAGGYHGGGRKSEGKSANIAIRCKPEELEKIKRNARDAGMTMSEYICKRCAE